MPVENGEYVQMTKGEIIDALEAEFQNEFGNDIDLTESSVFSSLAELHATVFAENQEQSLEDVYQSAFLDTATGEDLNKIVALIGIQRRDATHATGVQRFTSNNPVASTNTIQKGTVVQTDGDDPIEFETTEVAQLLYIDGFEGGDLSEYNGDTGSGTFSVVSTHPHTGANELQAGATSGDHIYHANKVLKRGGELHVNVYPEANTTPITTFGVQDVNNYYQIVTDCSASDGSEELRIEKVESGSVTQTIDTETGLDIPEGQYLRLKLDWNITGQMSVELIDKSGSSDTTVATAGGTDSDSDPWISGHVGFKSGDSTASKYWDEVSTKEVSANIRASEGGVEGNVGANTIVDMPSSVSGADETANLYPTGDTSYTDRNDDTFVVGTDEESDTELRERAKENVSKGGDATHNALLAQLNDEVDGVTSVTVYENKTDTDNTGSGGLPPHSFEAVVFGGNSQDIADAIFSKKAVTARDDGGAHGTSVSETVTSDINSQQFTIEFTRPSKLSVDMSMDIVVNDEYVGDNSLRDRIASYIGGTLSDGSSADGLDVGEDVYVDQIEDAVVGPDDTGVVGFDSSSSSEDITTTPNKTTNSNGLEIVDVGSNEVAETDSTDGSITINTTAV